MGYLGEFRDVAPFIRTGCKASFSETALRSLCRRLNNLFLLVCIMGGISFHILLLP